ncbi:response regulator [Clostridium sp. DL1XJH146]
MNKFKICYSRKSYKNKIRATYTTLMFVSLIIITVILVLGINNIVIPMGEEFGTVILENKASELGEIIYKNKNVLNTLSNTKSLRYGDINEIQEELSYQFKTLKTQYESITYVGIDGNSFTNNENPIVYSRSLNEILNGSTEYSVSSSFRKNDNDRLLISVATSVYDDNGNLKGALEILTYVDSLVVEATNNKLNKYMYYWLFDSEGRIVYHPDDDLIMDIDLENLEGAGYKGFEKINVELEEDASGELVIAYPDDSEGTMIYEEIPYTHGWIVAVSLFNSSFYEGMLHLLLIVFGIVCLISIIIFVVGKKVSNFVAKPLTEILNTLDSYSEFGEIIIPDRLKNNEDEIGILATTIDEMAASIRINISELNQEITSRELVENNLKILNDELEKRVEDRTIKLKEAKEIAEEANKSKSNFLANMSHEIRTPMNAIMGLNHLLSNTEIKPFQKDYIDKIDDASRTLLRIINDILDFSKIEAGKLELENIKFNIDKVMENLSNLLVVKARNKNIVLNFGREEDVPDALIGDPLRLEQILSNLLSNAIKFTEEGEVDVLVSLLENNEDDIKIQFEVKDTGIGLTEEQMKKLFSPFTQADGSTTRKYGGTGLGLAISKQLTEMMNGEIWADSEFGKGTSFYFTARLSKQKDKANRDFTPSPNLIGINVLIVDHNLTSLRILTRMLESFSFNVTPLRKGEDVVKELKNNKYELIILDWDMPDFNGIELYRHIEKEYSIDMPKTIFVSAYGRDTFFNQVNRVGSKYFLMKPINQSVLFDTVMGVFNEKKQYKEIEVQNKIDFNEIKNILSNKKVLLVEDNEINQLVGREILERTGVKVSIANNGEEAVKFIHNNKFDIVFMDVQMPILDGYEATRLIRKDILNKHLPIIAMTANALKGDREKSIRAGMNDYISKPIDPYKLYDLLLKWIGDNETISFSFEGDKLHNTIENNIVLDEERTLIRLGSNKKLYYELLLNFKENYFDGYKTIFNFLENEEWDELKRYIHTLKGVAGNISANKLYNNMQLIEEKLMENLDEIKFFINDTDVCIKEIIQIIDGKNQYDIEKTKDIILLIDLKEHLLELSKWLHLGKAKYVKEKTEYLKSVEVKMTDKKELDEILKLISKYRYKDAKGKLDKLLKQIEEEI